MGRPYRNFKNYSVYEITVRTKSGLPFPARPLIELLTKCALARALKNTTVTLCHDLAMANHHHILVFVKDLNDLPLFHGRFKKNLTDYIKRLLGQEYLNLWEDDHPAQILDFDDLIDRLTYFYANPAAAHLVDTIDDYPGYSTFKDFSSLPVYPDSSTTIKVPNIPASAIPELPDSLSAQQEEELINDLLSHSIDTIDLKIAPFAMLKGLPPPRDMDLESWRQRVIDHLRIDENEHREIRKKAGRKVKGSRSLTKELPSLTNWIPKKKEKKRLSFFSSSKELTKKFLDDMEWFQKRCRECYEAWKNKDFTVEWPPNAFQPPIPRKFALCCDKDAYSL